MILASLHPIECDTHSRLCLCVRVRFIPNKTAQAMQCSNNWKVQVDLMF